MGNAATAANHVPRTTNPTKRTGPRMASHSETPESPDDGFDDGSNSADGWFGGDPGGPPDGSPGGAAAGAPDSRAPPLNGLRPAGDAGCRRLPG